MFIIGLLLFSVVLVLIYVIFITTENNQLSGTNKRLQRELTFERRKNECLVEPLETISKQEPLTALRMLRDHLNTNK